MKLSELSVGERFKLVGGEGKIWQKISNNGDIAEYNYCRCIDNLLPEQKKGLMAVSPSRDVRMNKDAEVIIINKELGKSIKRELIRTIHIDEANFDHIRKHGQAHGINGTLLVEIERVMEEYAQIRVKEALQIEGGVPFNDNCFNPDCSKCGLMNSESCNTCGKLNIQKI